MKRHSLHILFFICSVIGYSQVKPDSLVGYYEGLYYDRYSFDPTWNIEPAIVNVTSIDDAGCWAYWFGPSFWCSPCEFETWYDFCFGNSSNYFSRFFEGDSLFIKYDDVPSPPPNTYTRSTRFYGKKILNVNVVELGEQHSVGIYPNPGNGIVIIDNPRNFTSYELFDINGNRLISGSVDPHSFPLQLDFSFLNPGIYMIRLWEDKTIQSCKIVIKR